MLSSIYFYFLSLANYDIKAKPQGAIYRFDVGSYKQYSDIGITFDTILNKVEEAKPSEISAILISPFHTTLQENTISEKFLHFTNERVVDVHSSIYASDELFFENGNISFAKESKGSEEILKNICQKAQKKGIIIMTDLVLNHLAKNSKQMKLLKKFYPKLKTNYSAEFKDVEAFNYADDESMNFVFDNLWKPYIDRLIYLGVGGFRIDAAGFVNAKLQQKISNYLASKTQNFYVIVEHWGIGDKTAPERSECYKIWNKKNIGLLFYDLSFLGTQDIRLVKEWQYGLPKWYNDQRLEVENNSLGMLGNHDELSLFQKALFLMAQEKFLNDNPQGISFINNHDWIEVRGEIAKEIQSFLKELPENNNLMNKIRKIMLSIAYEQIISHKACMINISANSDLNNYSSRSHFVFKKKTQNLRILEGNDFKINIKEKVEEMFKTKDKYNIYGRYYIEKYQLNNRPDLLIFIKHLSKNNLKKDIFYIYDLQKETDITNDNAIIKLIKIQKNKSLNL